jgi:hypothetical protein
MDEYHLERGVLTKSGSDRLHKSAAKYRAWRDGELVVSDTDALTDGRFLHMATLEPERFERDYFGIVEPEWGHLRATKTTSKEEAKANKMRREEWRASTPHWNSPNNLGEKHAWYKAISDRVHRHPVARDILCQGEAEKEFRREIETKNGDKITCKCRFDWIDENGAEFECPITGERRPRVIAADLKFVREDYAHPDKFWWMIRDHRYHVQQAFYSKIKPVDHWFFIVVEKTVPYDMAIYTLPVHLVIEGDLEVEEDLQLYADCKRENKWPGYPVKWHEIMDPRERKRMYNG